jgi:hypothetical protein
LKNNIKILTGISFTLTLSAFIFNTQFVSETAPNAMKERFRISLFKQCFFDSAFAACKYEPSELITDPSSPGYGHRIIKSEQCIDLNKKYHQNLDKILLKSEEHRAKISDMNTPSNEINQLSQEMQDLNNESKAIDAVYGQKCYK